jgi:hypothetical protein
MTKNITVIEEKLVRAAKAEKKLCEAEEKQRMDVLLEAFRS